MSRANPPPARASRHVSDASRTGRLDELQPGRRKRPAADEEKLPARRSQGGGWASSPRSLPTDTHWTQRQIQARRAARLRSHHMASALSMWSDLMSFSFAQPKVYS